MGLIGPISLFSCAVPPGLRGRRSRCDRSAVKRHRSIPVLSTTCAALALLAAAPAWAQAQAPAPDGEPLRYDVEYPAVGYAQEPRANAIVRLQERLDHGEVELRFEGFRGYLDSLLEALDIDPSSQTLVYSKTSLQTRAIRARTPRAIYFNDEVYVGWVQEGGPIELGAMDAELGPVFYTLENSATAPETFVREIVSCLPCHDSFSNSGGGVPRFLLISSYVDRMGMQLTHEGRIVTTDQTPIRLRWGGWYVTGRLGEQKHLGNLLIRNVEQLTDLDALRPGDLDALDGLFDTTNYLRNTSDVVALMVLQHQTDVQSLISRVNFEARQAIANGEEAPSEALTTYMEELLDGLFCIGAAELSEPIEGGSGFDEWFQAQGPHDSAGRSLRELDLETRLFRYPLSYVIYSEAFDALPEMARRYLVRRVDEILAGEDSSGRFDRLSAEDRVAIREILVDTKPGLLPG
jgi:hypothetical protein